MKLDAIAVARAFEVMLPVSTNGLTIERNPHRDDLRFDRKGDIFVPITAGEYIKGEALWYTGPTEQQKIEATGELWTLRYRAPDEKDDTILAAATLPALASWLQDNGLAFGS